MHLVGINKMNGEQVSICKLHLSYLADLWTTIYHDASLCQIAQQDEVYVDI